MLHTYNGDVEVFYIQLQTGANFCFLISLKTPVMMDIYEDDECIFLSTLWF